MTVAGVGMLKVSGYRSISGAASITVPTDMPLVLFGENNAGESYIIAALDLVLGEFWPGSHQPEDHESWDRILGEKEINIGVKLEGVFGKNGSPVSSRVWKSGNPNEEPEFECHYSYGGNSWVNNDSCHQCTVVLIGADRRPPHQVSCSSKERSPRESRLK